MHGEHERPAARHLRLPTLPGPLACGAGFKPSHLADILADPGRAGFFEIHAENYMGGGGPPHAMLRKLREAFPLSIHGVAMSIGGEAPLDKAHLARLKALAGRYEPIMVSEHLAWSTHENAFYNDLLPVPYTRSVLDRVSAHVGEVQDALGRVILLENPATYVTFAESEMSETDFLRDVHRRTGCGLLLDLNNVFVSATNHGYSPERYLADFPLDQVRQIHLAGHAAETDDDGRPLLIDTHDRAVSADVWRLFDQLIARIGPVPALIEWDNDVPAWPVLRDECAAAHAVLSRHAAPSGASPAHAC
jgi:uncharacterized protein (UPF0276 family)